MCERCGLGAGDADPYSSDRRVALRVRLTGGRSQEAEARLTDVEVVCSVCDAGHLDLPSAPDAGDEVLRLVRASSRDVQQRVYESLKSRFED